MYVNVFVCQRERERTTKTSKTEDKKKQKTKKNKKKKTNRTARIEATTTFLALFLQFLSAKKCE